MSKVLRMDEYGRDQEQPTGLSWLQQQQIMQAEWKLQEQEKQQANRYPPSSLYDNRSTTSPSRLRESLHQLQQLQRPKPEEIESELQNHGSLSMLPPPITAASGISSRNTLSTRASTERASTIQLDSQHSDESSQTKAEQIRSRISGSTYHDILLYNHAPDMDKGLDAIESLHRLLMTIGISFSIFQIILLGIIILTRAQCWFDESLSKTRAQMYYTCQSNSPQETALEVALYLCLVGFIVSASATIISFVAVEFMNGIRKENEMFIVAGVLHYKHIFRASEFLLWLDTFIWAFALNLAAHAWLRVALAISFNMISFFLAVFLTSMHWYVVQRKQEYSKGYSDDNGPSVAAAAWGEGAILRSSVGRGRARNRDKDRERERDTERESEGFRERNGDLSAYRRELSQQYVTRGLYSDAA